MKASPKTRRIALGSSSLAALILALTRLAAAQSFDSGSTGVDGAFVATPTQGSTVEFDPRRLHVDGDPGKPLIDPEHDNVFHFTTFTVPSGVTLKLSARWTNGPVYILTKGLPNQTNDDIALNVLGTIDASGEGGHPFTSSPAVRAPAVPGPGGYYGGAGGNFIDANTGTRAQNGSGPFGGLGAPIPGFHNGQEGKGASDQIGGPALVPLIGGSGGGGGNYPGIGNYGGGGGAGGGALLLASTRAINVNGGARVMSGGGYGGHYNGCSNYFGSGGAGGSIRLAAPVIKGSGSLEVYPGRSAAGHCGSSYQAPGGRVRLDAYIQNQSYGIPYGTFTQGTPLSSFVPATPPPVLRIVKINHQDVPTDINGALDPADFTLNTTDAVLIEIRAENVPVVSGSPAKQTVPTLYLVPLEGKDIAIPLPALQGDFQVSTTTINVALPSGFTRAYVKAAWTVP